MLSINYILKYGVIYWWNWQNKIKRIAIYLRKSRNKEGEETEETLAKHRKRLIDIAIKNKWSYELFQ
ncbi:hypothetical protein J25TS1_34260 [Bacillus paralicheniformis]|nr:hypothetical protein SC10_B2orf00297 [Bacillus paralicheniformis]GIN46216.1 hypothetical protein J23TS8_37830 [Bacillus paralicheniformis]GIN50172.1 hypothetical protein J25TS1_34260 [Bacillus paralicheniformis]